MEQFRRAHRPQNRRVIGGVAAGIAEHLNVPVLLVRIAFVATALFNFVGVAAYLVLWRFLPIEESDEQPNRTDLVQGISLLVLGLGAWVLLQATTFGVPALLAIPLGLAVVGVAIVWRQLDDAPKQSTMRTLGQLILGFAVMASSAMFLFSQNINISMFMDAVAAVVIALIGLAIALGSWMTRLVSQLGAERAERTRAQVRADMAAHLHDSVLQTLVLLQKNADDKGTVVSLARRQERELREWLYGSGIRSHESLVGLLQKAAAEVETDHGVAIEVVTVGDCEVDEQRFALVQALREAMVNAAKHANVDRIDVYVEISEREIDAFVRDRGVGFDINEISVDRHGITHSIRERMNRYGGDVTISSTVGEGTEVHILLKESQS